jgi:hypothetical protein
MRRSVMVFAVQCSNAKCRKFMLVEDKDRNKVVQCLICKTPIRLGTSATGPGSKPKTRPPGAPSG